MFGSERGKRCVPRFALLWALSACNSILGIEEATPRPEATGNVGNDAYPACTTNAECLAETGEYDPSACVSGSCVKLLTPDCPLLLPQTGSNWLKNLRSSDPDPVIFGVFSDVPASLYSDRARNIDLAFTEVTRAVGGLPGANGKRRPILAVVCKNHYEAPELFDAAVDHLIDDLGVPGILSMLDTVNLLHAFERAGHRRHVFFMSALGSEQAVADLTDDGLIWAELPGGAALAPTYAPLLDLTIEHLHNTGALGDNEKVRVALVRADDYVVLAELATAVTSVIEFNGKSAQDNAPDYFRAFSISSAAPATKAPDYSEAIQGLRDFAPHVVISAAASEFFDVFIPALESSMSTHPPTYLLSLGNYNYFIDTTLARAPMQCDAEVTPSCNVKTRMIGVNYAAAADPALYDAYLARFDAAYPASAGMQGYENYYDAAYHLIYAAAAAGPVSPLIGADLAQGMRRLLAGRLEFDVGPDDLPGAYVALQTPNSSITLNGTMGPPDFDPDTGARVSPGTVFCIDSASVDHADVLRLDGEGHLVGDFPCFPFP